MTYDENDADYHKLGWTYLNVLQCDLISPILVLIYQLSMLSLQHDNLKQESIKSPTLKIGVTLAVL